MELGCAGRRRRDVAQTLPGGGRCSGLAHAQGPIRFLQQLQSCPQPGLAALGNCKRITRGYLLCLESKNSDLGSELNKEGEQTQLLLVQHPQTGEELRLLLLLGFALKDTRAMLPPCTLTARWTAEARACEVSGLQYF